MDQGTADSSEPVRLRGPGKTPKLRVEIGQRFGRGAIIDPDVRIPVKSRPGKTYRGARLVCDCGNEYTGTLQALLTGHLRSCSCLRKDFVDRLGHRYGKLVVIRYLGVHRRKGGSKTTLWLCKCDCGNETEAGGMSLARGGTVSCGCIRRNTRYKDAPHTAARNKVLASYKGTCARSRGLTWELADEDFERLMTQDCRYCGQPPSVITRAGVYEGGEFVHGGLDRMDNSLGYTLENTVPCCITCNHAKMAMPYDDFMAWISRLIAHHWFNPEMTPSARLKAVI